MRVAIAFLFSVSALASPCLAQAQDIQGNCARFAADRAQAAGWPRPAELASDIAGRYCGGKLMPEKMSVALLEFLDQSVREFEALGIGDAVLPLRARVAAAKAVVDAGNPIGNMDTLPPAFGPGLSFHGEAKVMDVQACDAAVARARAAGRVRAADCNELLELYAGTFAPLQLLVQRAYTKEVKEYLEGLQRQWDDFLTKSRSQTSWELALNSWLWRRDKKAGTFLAPPERQLILVHPSVVLEHVGKAADGNRSQEGIMIEVLGANWWKNDEWYKPSGASYIRLYSDRAGLPDWANGVAVHFGNKYTLGATRRDGRTGYFLSVDVLELYKDKRRMLHEYTANLPVR